MAYRRHREDIWKGKPSDKYKRLLPHIEGNLIVEIGAAEGVLALMLAQRADTLVAAVERHQGRHWEACRLKDRWRELGRNVDRCRMVLGDIQDHLALLNDADTLVAIRCIYYFKDKLDTFFDEVSLRGVKNVVLCGNPGRADRYLTYKGKPPDKLGKYNFYASIEGMRTILTSHGYQVVREISKGDPIVIGIRNDLGSNP